MLLIAVSVLLILSPLVVGRWPARLLLHRWRMPLLIWSALLIQIVALEVPALVDVAPALHVLTYLAAGTFLWLNHTVPGALVVGAGALSNGVTILLNGGTLPTTAEAVAAAGIDHGDGFSNTSILADPVLPWLGDVFAWPAPMPLANTFSVGDVLIVVGVGLATWTGTRPLGRATPDRTDQSPSTPT